MNSLYKALRFLRTIRYLKPSQIFYQLFYKLKGRPKFNVFLGDTVISNINYNNCFFIKKNHKKVRTQLSTVEFNFLNLKTEFLPTNIQWNFSKFGKLWTYHLNYFDFLFPLSKDDGLKFIQQYIDKSNELIDGLEPYPTSLRIINWIKFDLQYRALTKQMQSFLRSDLERLNEFLEYHIQANHLLENSLALYAGSLYFKNQPFLKRSQNLLFCQLEEQFGDTGFHYENSFMYHLSLMERILDVLQISKSTNNGNRENEEILANIISKGLSIASYYEIKGSFPNFNDSNTEETPDFFRLCNYAKSLGIDISKPIPIPGLFMKRCSFFSLIADYSNIRPAYQPGHAHADTFTFVIFNLGKPLIVDPAISTYEKNSLRELERSTLMHNTICINYLNSSETWAGFRVGRRAEVFDIRKTEDAISAWHNGYKSLKVKHNRRISLIQDCVMIEDILQNPKNYPSLSSIHFHPDVKVEVLDGYLVLNDSVLFEWSGVRKWECSEYDYSEGYNLRKKGIAWKAEVENISSLKISKFSI